MFYCMKTYHAKWAETIEPTFNILSPKPPYEYQEIDIPGNSSRELCLVAKVNEEPNAYIFNLDSYLQQNIRRPNAIINQGINFLRIIIKGSNFQDKYFWFILENHGKNSRISLSQILDKKELARIKSITNNNEN